MLTQKTMTQERKLRLRWFVAMSSLPLLGVVTAFGIMPQSKTDAIGNKSVIQEIALPRTAQPVGHAVTFWRNDRVQRGDTVAEQLRRLNVDDIDASNYLRKNPAAASFRQLAVGKSVQAETDADGNLLALRYPDKDGNQIVIEKKAGQFVTYTLPAQLEQHVFMRTGEIKTSLFAATDEANLPDPAANQLADIFGGDIDFHHDLRRGDKFTVVYEMTYSNGEPLRAGRILAAEFVNRGKSFRAVYFQTDGNHGDYYTPDGKSMHKAFLRSPVEFSRISSGFSLARFHPFLHKWRAHKGVDFAAPIGTKVKVTADGVVSFVGQQRGYGNVIMVNHQRHLSTVYGHLSRFARGLHRGQHVTQGEVIGYVGMTGWATGPHLHYEFRINGIQHDPMRVALPDASPISSAQMAVFRKDTSSLIARLGLPNNTNLAQLD
jgi:murein DD-endopeptidase MepM/ murein hydrolase activator NlpD